MHRLLGIDPGLAITGYGVVDIQGSRHRHRRHGVIRTNASEPIESRLQQIFQSLQEIVAEHRPTTAAVESLYFAKNATSAFPVAHARGVILLALAEADVACHEYSPKQIKQRVVGVGAANKAQVQELVRLLLGLAEVPAPDHAADALAVALCHAQSVEVPSELGGARGV